MLKAGRLLRQIWRHAKREKRLSLGSFLVLLIVLMLVNIFWIGSINLNTHYQSLLKTVRMEVFIANDYPDSLVNILETSLYELADVATSDFISREEAAAILQSELGPGFLEGLEENPLPRSFVISFQGSKGLEELENISAGFAQLEGVSAVEFGRAWMEKVEGIANNIKQVGLVIGIVIMFVVLLTMANTNRLTARSKSSDFYQLKLLGAGPVYLLYPFLAEGFFSGLISAVIGWLIIIYLSGQITFADYTLLLPPGKDIIIYCLSAGFIGLIGSYLGIRRLLL